MLDAYLVFSRASWQIMSGFENIRSFQEITEFGLPFAEQAMQRDSEITAHFVIQNPEFNSMFTDKEGLLTAVGGIKGMADSMSLQRLSTYKDMVTSMTLVFAHSILDGAISDYLTSIAIHSPEAFDQFIMQKKVTLQLASSKPTVEIRNDLVSEYVEQLSRNSMIDRVDKIFALCTPETTYRPISGYTYDRERLFKLDRLRHEIIHDNIRINDLPNGTADLLFMRQTGLYLMAIIHNRFGLAMVPSLMFPGNSGTPRKA